MKALACLLLVAAPAGLSAQHVSIGPQVAFGDYREVSSDLHYRGAGAGVKVTLTWKKFSADVDLSKVKYKPQTSAATADFDASEVDVRLRYYVTGPVSAELGFINRKMKPEFEAQSVGAVTLGARMAYVLGPGVRMALLVGVALCFFQGWSGGTAVNFYAPLIFQKASSLGASGAIFQTLMLNVSSLIFTTVALFLVDVAGRRPLLLIGSAGMAATLGFLGLCLHRGLPGIYSVVTVFAFNMFYQISVAPLAWLILSEIFPTRLRAKGQSVGTLAVWVSTYLSNQFLGPMMSYFEKSFGSVGPAFWVFGVICLLILVFGWKMVPETKQKTLEEIAGWWQHPQPATTSR